MITILVVEDNVMNAGVLKGFLETAGYAVQIAHTGRRAFDAIRAEIPHLILLDVLLPDIDGFDLCRRFKADERTRDIPVIFLTALDDIEHKLTGFQVGGIDYIVKPFLVEEVLIRVRTHLLLRAYHLHLKTLLYRWANDFKQEHREREQLALEYHVLQEIILDAVFQPTEVTLKEAVAQFETMYITRAILGADGNMKAAAQALGIATSTLCRKCQKYHIEL